MNVPSDIPLILLGQLSLKPLDLSTYAGAVEYLEEAVAAHLPGASAAAVRNAHPAFDPVDQLGSQMVMVRAGSQTMLSRVRMGDPDLTAIQACDAAAATAAVGGPIPPSLCAELIYSQDGVARALIADGHVQLNCGARLSPPALYSLRPDALVDLFTPPEAMCRDRRLDPLQRDVLVAVVTRALPRIRYELEQARAA